MKTLLKLLVVDSILLISAIIFGKVPFLGTILIAVTVFLSCYIGLEYVRLKKEELAIASIPIEDKRRNLINEKLEKARSTIKSVEGLKVKSHINIINSDNNDFVDRAERQLEKFFKKEKALHTIIGLNEGGCSTTLIKNSLDVYETLVENYRRMSKRIVAYAATNNADIKVEIERFIEANDNLLNLYNRLIDEVSRMGDNINEQDEALQSLINNLQELRQSNEGNDDESSEEPFKLTTFPEE